jgi:ubiquinone biosynthesis protein
LLDIFRLRRTYKSARRLQQIINVFLRHGFGRIIDQIHLGRYIPFRTRLKAFGQWPAVGGPTVSERLRIAFEELGPTFIKLAQILSSRPDLITQQYADEFRKLLDEVPPFPASDARRIISDELKEPLDSIFMEFQEVPVAAASIAQVHNAVLSDGTEVIVKVQRPNIKERILSDIEIIGTVARLMERHIPESRFFNPTGIVQEFSRTVRKELDFTEEARNCAKFARNFTDVPGVHIPMVFTEHFTEKVLVMERIKGARVDEVGEIDVMGLDRAELAREIVDTYLKMILEDGFFHADPHPGNIFIMPDGRICFMDFGIVGRVSEETKETLAETFVALLRKDYDGLVEHYIELGHLPEDADVDTFRREFKADLMDLIEPLYGAVISEINIAEYLDTVLHLASRHRLIVPSDLLLIDKTLIHLDNVVRQLYPEFDFISATEPYAERLLKERLSPFKAVQRISKELAEAGDSLLLFPKQSRKILSKVLKDDIHLKTTLTGLEKFIRDMDRSSNRIAFAMVLSAIILSSAIMHAMSTGPLIFGFSALGIVTFIGAVVLGIWLLISIIRSGRL